MTCKLCIARGKTWEGADPTCGFPNGAAFDVGNWNCATVSLIRDLCGSPWADAPEGVAIQYGDDQTYAMIRVCDVDLDPGASSLWVSWYKRRGRTEALWLLSESEESPPRLPTEADCRAIIRAYAARLDAADRAMLKATEAQ